MKSIEEKMAAVEAAAAAKTGQEPATVGVDYGAPGGDMTVVGHLDRAELELWTVKELKALAADMGLKMDGLKKSEIIDAITAEEVAAPAEEPDEEETEEPEQEDDGQIAEIGGRVLVTFTGDVNLRDMQGNVDGGAFQGQVLPVRGVVERNGATWYKVEDRAGKEHLISGQVVRYME